MAMRRNANAKSAPKAKETQAPTPEKTQEAAPLPTEEPVTETAVVVHEDHAVATKPAGKMVTLFSDLENAFVADYGVLKKIKASNGNCMDSDDKVLGDTIDVQILSWNKQFVIGPCANEAPDELVKYSYDREAFADGSGTLNEYVRELKAEGWVNAAIKEYYEVVCMLVDSAKKSDLVGEMVQLQLSPTSVKSFDGFRLQTAFKIARGLLPEDAASTVTVTAEVVSSRGNSWTKFNFKPKA